MKTYTRNNKVCIETKTNTPNQKPKRVKTKNKKETFKETKEKESKEESKDVIADGFFCFIYFLTMIFIMSLLTDFSTREKIVVGLLFLVLEIFLSD
mgnify:CR=1 FL=1|jgi:hypothetical protein